MGVFIVKNNKSNQQRNISVRRISAFKVFCVAFAVIFAILTFEFLGLIAATLWDAILSTAEQHFNTVFTFSKVFLISSIVMLIAGFVILINRIAVIEAENRRQRQLEEEEFEREQQRFAQARAQQQYQQRPVNRQRPFDQDAQPHGYRAAAPQQRSATPTRKEEILVLPASTQRRAQ